MRKLLFAFTLLLSSVSYSDDQLTGSKYYMIQEPAVLKAANKRQLFQNALRSGAMLNLMAWAEINQAPPVPTEKYQRDKQFGTWLDYQNDNTCLSVRGLILQERSQAPISVYPDNTCAVKSGQWFDPYTNKTLINAQDVQLDHMVPLKQAYIAGGFNWAPKYKCAYFNFRGNPYHLVPIYSETNNVKMDSRPDQWLPPYQPYACQYIANWLKIKLIWKLMMSQQEAVGLMKKAKALNCNPQILQISLAEVVQQRAEIEREASLCPTGR